MLACKYLKALSLEPTCVSISFLAVEVRVRIGCLLASTVAAVLAFLLVGCAIQALPCLMLRSLFVAAQIALCDPAEHSDGRG